MDSKDINDIDVFYEVVSVSPELSLNEKFKDIILTLVFKHTGYDKETLKSRSRKRKQVEARQLNMYFLKKHTNYTLEIIGELFNRDHATVLHAVKTINNLIETNKEIRRLILTIKNEIEIHIDENMTTKYSVFQDLLDAFIEDDEQKKIWNDKYLDAV